MEPDFPEMMHTSPPCVSNICPSNCHCINETRNPINGACPDGECKRGYKDDNCSTGMWYWWLIVISTYSTSNRYVYYSQDTDV